MRYSIVPLALLLLLCCSMVPADTPPWGFYGHRRINRLAVFTLPAPLSGFFKKHIEFITEHAVDPDKRRYATRHEAVRHYIDIDHWGEYPFPEVPRNWVDALARYTDFYGITAAGDSLHLLGDGLIEWRGRDTLAYRDTVPAQDRLLDLRQTSRRQLRGLIAGRILPQYYEDEWELHPDTLALVLGLQLPDGLARIAAVDRFSPYGIVPYHLVVQQNRLTEAFRQKSVGRILRLAAEMGHYLGDAHVPLHTTANYNGQLTNQIGIHAFWESRIPELFADEEYDYFVGAATYIADPKAYFWEVVLASHRMVDSVLTIEKELSRTYPRDQQYCFAERLGRTIRTQCPEYARAYQEALNGQVERRMRATIRAVGSSWYTAWVDAGQPDLTREGESLDEQERRELEELEAAFRKGEAKGRLHE